MLEDRQPLGRALELFAGILIVLRGQSLPGYGGQASLTLLELGCMPIFGVSLGATFLS